MHDYLRIFDPATETFETPVFVVTGGDKFRGGFVLPDGRIVIVPSGVNTIPIYDPSTGVMNTSLSLAGTPGDVTATGGVGTYFEGEVFESLDLLDRYGLCL